MYGSLNGRDADSGLLWWTLVVCDRRAVAPGANEAAGEEGTREKWTRDRHITLSWKTLDRMLQLIAEVGRRRCCLPTAELLHAATP